MGQRDSSEGKGSCRISLGDPISIPRTHKCAESEETPHTLLLTPTSRSWPNAPPTSPVHTRHKAGRGGVGHNPSTGEGEAGGGEALVLTDHLVKPHQ